MMVSCVRPYMVETVERVNYIHAQIIRAKCNRCKESVSIENTNHVETYMAKMDASMIKVMWHHHIIYMRLIKK